MTVHSLLAKNIISNYSRSRLYDNNLIRVDRQTDLYEMIKVVVKDSDRKSKKRAIN